MVDWKSGLAMKNVGEVISMSEINIILDKARNHNYRNYLILYMLLRSGRRIGELLDLKPKDISFERKMILWNIEKKHKRLKDKDGKFEMWVDEKGINHHKTEKIIYKRWKPLDNEACDKLKDFIEKEEIQEDEYIFKSPYNENKHISRIAVWIFLSKYAKELQIKIHPHTLRHSFAIAVAQKMKSPADLVKLSNHLEHSNIQVTEGYLQFAPEETRKLLEETFNEK